MNEESEAENVELPLEGVGARLRRAREEAKMTLAQVGAETRIPLHHLEVIEAGDLSALPARTYAIGFSRTYAKAVGLDENAIATQVREELAEADMDRRAAAGGLEPGDPAKLPSSGLAYAGVFASILLVAGMVAFYSTYYGSGTGPAPLVDDSAPVIAEQDSQPVQTQGAPALSAASADGQVVFTALEDGVWVRFYDANGERLLEKQMASGERFEIPADAQEPRINTGRPDAFAITVGGREVPKLADEPMTIGDAPVSAAALLARADEVPTVPGEPSAPTFN